MLILMKSKNIFVDIHLYSFDKWTCIIFHFVSDLVHFEWVVIQSLMQKQLRASAQLNQELNQLLFQSTWETLKHKYKTICNIKYIQIKYILCTFILFVFALRQNLSILRVCSCFCAGISPGGLTIWELFGKQESNVVHSHAIKYPSFPTYSDHCTNFYLKNLLYAYIKLYSFTCTSLSNKLGRIIKILSAITI